MPWPHRARRTLLLAASSVALLAAGAFWIAASRDPRIPYLDARGTGEWIVYPTPARLDTREVVELPCTFRRSFRIDDVPAAAPLRVRGFRRFEVAVNGEILGGSPPGEGDWKEVSVLDVAAALRLGENEILVTVRNDTGPPALWLTLDLEDRSLVSDRSWDASLAGATWERVRLARTPLFAGFTQSEDTAVRATLETWPVWAGAALVAAVAVLAGAHLGRRRGAARGLSQRERSGLPEIGPPRPGSQADPGGPASLPADSLVPSRDAGGSALDTERPARAARSRRRATDGGAIAWGGLGVAVLLWSALFWNDLPRIRHSQGFDAHAHVEYIESILETRRLPLADEGWEMYQPPLYYAVSALALGAFGLTPGSDSGLALLRGISWACGLVMLVMVLASLRLLFPGRSAPQLVGLTLAAFVPVHLSIYQGITNEAFAATVSLVAIYLGLRALRDEDPSPAAHAALGVALGAALLAKTTALLVAILVLGALGIRLVTLRRSSRRAWLVGLGLPSLFCLAVSGWHYARVWARFGSPLVGNWDIESGQLWWQQPGYRTAGDYLRFGRVFTSPSFSGFNGFLDGMWSTFWGDGLWSGVGTLEGRPAWNWSHVQAGYLLALGPAVLILAGGIVAIAVLVRRAGAAPPPGKATPHSAPALAGGLFLAAAAAAYLLALLAYSLAVPSYATFKAFYALPAVLPLAACAGLGFETLTRGRPVAIALLSACLAAWAVNSYAAFWIQIGAPESLCRLGLDLSLDGRLEEARVTYEKALALDPRAIPARLGLAYIAWRAGDYEGADLQAEQILDTDPSHAEALRTLARASARKGRTSDAVLYARRAAAAASDDGHGAALLGRLLHRQGDLKGAIESIRRAIGAVPDEPSHHAGLAELLEASGDTGGAIEQLDIAARIDPADPRTSRDLAKLLGASGRHKEAAAVLRRALGPSPTDPELLASLAWILATSPDDSLRDGAEAVRLAKAATRGAGMFSVPAADALAAAYAETGRFGDAAARARTLAASLRESGQVREAEAIEGRMRVYEAGRPYRDPGEALGPP